MPLVRTHTRTHARKHTRTHDMHITHVTHEHMHGWHRCGAEKMMLDSNVTLSEVVPSWLASLELAPAVAGEKAAWVEPAVPPPVRHAPSRPWI